MAETLAGPVTPATPAGAMPVGATVLASDQSAIATGTDASTLATGTTIDQRYVVSMMLGRGGMGTVYLARDLSLGRDVALKLHRSGSGHERLYREAVAMAQLQHPNVVTVFEVGTVEDQLFVAMEYIRGWTLRDWATAKPRTWREILEVLLDVGEGLAAAHRAGFVHRDFKPENVLVGEDGRPRVSDFGLARGSTEITVSMPPSVTSSSSSERTSLPPST
ncbi:MAG: Serine/threonine kinase family protein, partial [Myxococcales bacterium]|nr:Serine/threonine kinase family protein [Myxococcales bacterium]